MISRYVLVKLCRNILPPIRGLCGLRQHLVIKTRVAIRRWLLRGQARQYLNSSAPSSRLRDMSLGDGIRTALFSPGPIRVCLSINGSSFRTACRGMAFAALNRLTRGRLLAVTSRSTS